MADKYFGVKRINLVGAAGTPTITSPTDLIINANTVAISTNVIVGGIVTATKFVGNLVGIATTAINLYNGSTGSLPYQYSAGITTFLSAAGTNNQVLLYDTGTNKPYWGNVSAGSGSFGGITVKDEGGTSYSSIITLDIYGSNITATSGGTGIASIRVSDNLVGTALSISGISTLGTVQISSGIVTSTTGTAITFVGNLTGTASTASFATTAYSLNGVVSGDLKVAYATTAGIATNLGSGSQGSLPYQYSAGITTFLSAAGTNNQVLLYDTGSNAPYWGNVSAGSGSFGGITVKDEGGTSYSSIITLDIYGSNIIATNPATGIASIRVSDNLVGTALSISGISTLGGVQISSGIVTSSTVGTDVIYYGDGSKLKGVSGTSIVAQDLTSAPVYPVLANNAGVSSVGIATTGSTALVFIPSNGNLGIGTTNPQSKLTIQGDLLITGVTTSGIVRISSSTASPNASIPIATLEAVGTSSDYDIAIVPKGLGSIVARIPDGTTSGGNKRGNYAVDLQISRGNATQIASDHFAVITGGSNNTAKGQYTFVGSGYNNIAGANSHSSVVGGSNNDTSGGGSSFIGGGNTNKAQSDYNVICGGSYNQTLNQYASILGGNYGVAKKTYSSVIGGYGANTRNTYGAVAFAGANSTFGTGSGVALQQARFAILSKETTNTTPNTLTANGSTYDGDNVFDIPANTAYLVKGSVIAYSNASNIARAWEFTTAIKRQSGSPSLVGTPIINDIAYDSGTSGWSLSITADSSTNSLKVEVIGQSSTTIRWVTKIDSTEVGF